MMVLDVKRMMVVLIKIKKDIFSCLTENLIVDILFGSLLDHLIVVFCFIIAQLSLIHC